MNETFATWVLPVDWDEESLLHQFEVDWLRAELEEARIRAERMALAGSAAEAYIFDRMTAAGYKLNLLNSEYYIP